MKQSTKDTIARIDARLIETEQALLVSAKIELERISADYSEVSKLLYEIFNSDSELTPEVSAKLHAYVNRGYK